MIAFFSFRFFIELVEGNPIPFALNYSFGHILQLLSSMFLCGPKRQFKYVINGFWPPCTRSALTRSTETCLTKNAA